MTGPPADPLATARRRPRRAPSDATDYRVQIHDNPSAIDAAAWDALVDAQPSATPFLHHAYLQALHDSGSATAETGWAPHFLTLHPAGDDELLAACPLYLKFHSYGEYVFDWAWADAYERHGERYYPKLLDAVPFTPVPGPRLLARVPGHRLALLQAMQQIAADAGLSSAHLLFLDAADLRAAQDAGWMLRSTVQFHWHNRGAEPAQRLPPDAAAETAATGARPGPQAAVGPAAETAADGPPARAAPYADFAEFLASLQRDKRKKIQQERRRVREAGVTLRAVEGAQIDENLWGFFYRCYTHTYRAHGSTPYLTRDFFARVAAAMPAHWLLFVAEREGRRIAASLIALDPARGHAYGRYWGCTEPVDCLHFEACYYAPLEWCIAHGYQRFEGGAQGEHKMARGLMPVATHSAHWLTHPQFADAVARFLEREGAGVEAYVGELRERNPFKAPD